jgi:multidrug resistance protein, MATE family
MYSLSAYTPHARATLALGLPLAGSQVAMFALHLIDTIMLGWYGVAPLAAGVLGSSTFFIIFVLGSGFGKAVMPLVAAAQAKGDERQVRRDTRMGLWLSILFGILCYPIFWQSKDILLALGQTPEVAGLSQDYLRVAGLGMVPALMVLVLRSYLSALERTQIVLWITLAALPVNALLNWALIFGNWGAPELGVRGAAIATVIVQVFSLVLAVAYAVRAPGLQRYHLFQRFWRPDWAGFRTVFRLGWPIGLTGLAEGGLFHASALMMGWIGTIELAAHGIALEVAAVTFMLHVGLSNAATVRTGQMRGIGDWAGVRLGAQTVIALSLFIAGLTVLLFLTLPEALISPFIDPSDPDRAMIMATGTALLACAALFQLADSMQVMALGLLAGMQDTRVPMILASISYWLIGVPASYALAFPLGMGAVGLWLGLVIGLGCAALSLMTRFWLRLPRG